MKKESKLEKKEAYIAPDIKVVKIEMEQNIFAGSNGNLPGMGAENW